MSPGPLPHSLIVTGDVLTDRHLYTGERSRPKLANRRGMISVSEAGGAAIVYRLLDSIVGQDKTRGAVCSDWTVHLMHEASTQSGYAVWSPRPLGPEEPDKKTMVWRTKELLGYGCATGGDTIQKTSDEGVPEKCGIMIIDDAGLGFRHRADGDFQALLDRLHCNGVLLLKMSERAGREGPENLWRFLSTKDWRHPATDGAGAENSPKRQTLVGLISARDLRREPLGLDAGLSWEATLDDLRIALHERGTTSFLRSCTHLIVTFSADAAVWLDQSDPSNPKVIACLDPARAEGEWGGRLEGDVIGYHAAMTAAIATGIIRYIDAKEPREALNFGIPMEAGLVAMRQLRRLGHGEVTNIPPAGYPHERLAKQIRDIRSEPARMEARFRHFELNWTQRFDGPGPDWNLIVDEQRRLVPLGQPPLVHLAKQVVLYGTQALEHLPHAKFGSLITADRRVIEALRNIRRQMQAYHANPKPERPLNIAVFGPPGAGKSFGVKQLSNEVFGKDAWRLFNLSQFENNQDLNGAFHQVRDAALSGITPVVFWDEFDSHELDWLQYLLSPMQDGRFQDRQLNHGIGKCVFVFAGGTATTYDEFKGRSERGAGSSSEAIISFRNKKGPDFVSRLDAYLDVLGPNPRTISDICKRRKPDPNDMLYSLRRALLIRHFLHCGETDRIDFDTGLLNALLRVPAYRHGARSLEKIMENIRRDNGVSVRRSTLPLRAQLEMHVDPEEFLGYLDRESPLPVLDFTWQQIEKSASCIHEAWKVRQTDCKHRVDDALNVALSDLPDPYREANRAAVARMPMILDMAGLKFSEGNAPAGLLANQYEEHIAPIIEYLSEVEHNGWVNQRVSSGWRYNKDRDERDGRHPAMVPYAQLVERYKDNDRGNIRLYHAICIGAGRSIVRK